MDESQINKKLKESKKRLENNLEKISQTEEDSRLVIRMTSVIAGLGERHDERIDEIAKAYYSIVKEEKDISRVPWRFLEYLEANHRDLYREVQTASIDPRT